MRAVLKILLAAGAIDEARLQAAGEALAAGTKPILALVESGADQERIADALADALRTPRLDIVRATPEALSLVPEHLIVDHMCLPIQRLDDRRLLLGMVDPTDVDAVEFVRFASKLSIVQRTISYGDWARAVRELGFETGAEIDPIVRITNMLLVEAALEQPFSLRINRLLGTATGPPRLGAVDARFCGAIVERLREMCDPAPGALWGGIHLRMGTDSYFVMVHLTPDDGLTTVRAVTLEEFTEAFGPQPQ